jgi:hypothetical protein
MRLLAAVLALALGAGILAGGGVPAARAASPADPVARIAPAGEGGPPAAPRPGTGEEERDYARREAESPEVQEFTGGAVFISISIGLFTLLLIVLIVVLVSKD